MTIQMIDSSVGEALHLFGIMEKLQVPCSLELKNDNQADPFVGIASQPVRAEYVETFDGEGRGDTVVITLGETEFAFELNFMVSKYISDCQIDLCIAKENYTAWFSSGLVPPEAINEAHKYREATDGDEHYPVNISGYEEMLINFIRTLEFDDLLDANEVLIESAQKAQQKAVDCINTQNYSNASGWQNRSIALMKLANVLSESNADYRAHIFPEADNNEH